MASADAGKPLPPGTVFGKLPRKYGSNDLKNYLEQVGILFNRNSNQSEKPLNIFKLNEGDHFNFILWFETKCKIRERKNYIQQYLFALNGIGLFPKQQGKRLECLGLDSIKFYNPSPNYYPKILPLELFELLKRIPEISNSRKWKHNLSRISTLVSLIYQSSRIDYRNHKVTGKFAVNYFVKHTESSKTSVLKDIKLLEKYNILAVIKHGYKAGDSKSEVNIQVTNQYYLTLTNKLNTFPLIYTNCINSGTHWALFDCFRIARLLYGDQKTLPFKFSTWHRRHKSARIFATRGQNAFLHGKKQAFSNKTFPESWPTFEYAKREIDKEKSIILSKLKSITINPIYLDYKIKEYSDELPNISADNIEYLKLKQKLKLAELLRNKGINAKLSSTNSGRLKAAKGKENIANPFTTSKKYDKYGYDFWCCINEPFFETDITGADVLSGSLITHDECMFNDYMTGDFYNHGRQNLCLPDTLDYRKLVKYLHLVIQYGGGFKNTYPNQFENLVSTSKWQSIFTEYKSYLIERYPRFFSRCKDFIIIGGYSKNRLEHPSLPNGFGLTIEKPYVTPAHVIQAVTKIQATRLFLEIERRGYDPVFEIHDAVITRNHVPFKLANEIMVRIVKSLLKELCLSWSVPDSAQIIKSKNLEFREAA